MQWRRIRFVAKQLNVGCSNMVLGSTESLAPYRRRGPKAPAFMSRGERQDVLQLLPSPGFAAVERTQTAPWNNDYY